MRYSEQKSHKKGAVLFPNYVYDSLFGKSCLEKYFMCIFSVKYTQTKEIMQKGGYHVSHFL